MSVATASRNALSCDLYVSHCRHFRWWDLHNQNCTRPGLQVVFEPCNGVQIQHVRRLIKHEKLHVSIDPYMADEFLHRG